MNQPMEAQRNQDPKLLTALGLKRYRPRTEADKPRIEPAHAEDPPTSGLPLSPDTAVHQAKQIDSMFEEWWQKRTPNLGQCFK